MKWVVRAVGFIYSSGREEKHDCYLDECGNLTVDWRHARVYASASEAWDHARASGFTGTSDAGCHVEEIK